MAKKDAIVEQGKFDLVALDVGVDEISDMIKANVGEDGIDAFDLTRAINPTSGNLDWKIPGLEDTPEETSEVEGIIVYHRKVRVYWPGEFKPGSPPACVSADGVSGEGDPGGFCNECPFSKFGSGKNDGQACNAVKQLFMIRSGELLPTLFNITAVNIKKPNKYLLDLLSKARLKYNAVITRIRNEPDKSNSGYDYARTEFSMARRLSDDEKSAAEAMTAIFEPLLSTRAVTIDVTPEQASDPTDPTTYDVEPDF